MTKFTGTLCLLLLSCCAMLPPPGKIAMGKVDFMVRDFKLPNGMRVVIEEDHATDKAAVIALVGAGSAADPVGKEGLAHFVEHLAFRTRPDNKLTATQMLDFAGASMFNAATSLDDTTYFVLGPCESLPALLAITSAQLLSPGASVDAETFEVERAVVRNELRLRTETLVEGQLFSWIQEAAFPKGHRYARPLAGTHESLTAITAADVQKFTDEHYQPSNITLLIIGDLDSKSVDALLRSLPPALAEGKAAKTPSFAGRVGNLPEEPPASPPRALVRKQSAAVQEPELNLVWTLPSAWGSEAAVQRFAVNAISVAISRAYRDDDIASIQVGLIPGVDATLLHVRARLKEGKDPQASMDHVLDQLVQVWANKSPVLVGYSRLEAVMAAAFAAEDIVSRGQERAAATHWLGEPSMYGRRMADVGRVDSAKVVYFAEKYLTRERARAIYVEPVPEAERPAATPTGVGTRLAKDATPSVVYPKEEILKLARQPSLAGSHRFTLDNGLQVLVVRRTNMPLVTVSLGLKGGTFDAEPVGAAELADWLSSPRNTIHGWARQWGASSWDTLGERSMFVTWRGANGNLANLLALVSDRVGSMRVERHDVMGFRDRNLTWLASRDQRAERALDRKVLSALYPSHRFGVTATSEHFADLSESALDDWLDVVYQPEGARLVIVGDVDPLKTEPLVRSWLSGWSKGDGHPAAAAPALPASGAIELGQRAGATQSQVTLSCRLPDATGKARVANDLLAKLLEVKLEEVLRKQLGTTYGVHALANDGVGGVARLTVSTSLSAEDQLRAFSFLHATWMGLGTEGWDLNEINHARWELARDASLWGRTPSGLAQQLVQGWMEGIDPADQERYPATLVALTDLELEESWNVCKASTVLSVLGDKDGVTAALQKAGWLKGTSRASQP